MLSENVIGSLPPTYCPSSVVCRWIEKLSTFLKIEKLIFVIQLQPTLEMKMYNMLNIELSVCLKKKTNDFKRY